MSGSCLEVCGCVCDCGNIHSVGLEEFVFEACVVSGVGVVSHAIEEPFVIFCAMIVRPSSIESYLMLRFLRTKEDGDDVITSVSKGVSCIGGGFAISVDVEDCLDGWWEFGDAMLMQCAIVHPKMEIVDGAFCNAYQE